MSLVKYCVWVAAGLALTCSTARATSFTGSAVLFPSLSTIFDFDTSQLSIFDTPDGFKVSGLLVATVSDPGGASGEAELFTAARSLGSTHSPFPVAHLSVTVEAIGDIVAFAVLNRTSIWPNIIAPCASTSAMIHDPAGLSGHYSAPAGIGEVCESFLTSSLQQLVTFSFTVPAGAVGSRVQFIFGNSSDSEAIDLNEVPEPSTISGGIAAMVLLLVAMGMRIRTPISRS